jgi:hypothetical protein
MPEHYTNEPPTEAGRYWYTNPEAVGQLYIAEFNVSCGTAFMKDESEHKMPWPVLARWGYQRSVERIPTPEEVSEMKAVKEDRDRLLAGFEEMDMEIQVEIAHKLKARERATKAEAERDELRKRLEGGKGD